jgi:hypothetical protein
VVWQLTLKFPLKSKNTKTIKIDQYSDTELHEDGSAADFFFFFLVCEAIGTAATPGLLCQPRVIVKMIVERQMECRLTGETCPITKSHMTRPGFEPGSPRWEAGDQPI